MTLSPVAIVAAGMVTLAAMIAPQGLAAQPEPQLLITSPTPGARITRGAEITISVDSAAIPLRAVMVQTDLISRPFLGKTEPPFTFHITVPNDAPPGPHGIEAIARTVTGELIESLPVFVIVDTGQVLSAIRVEGPPMRVLTYRGERLKLSVYASYTDGCQSNRDRVRRRDMYFLCGKRG